MSDSTVTLAEVAAAMGRNPEQVEAEAAELGMLVEPDWAGRRSLSVDDARGLASGEARRNLEHDRGWQAHLRECKLWREGRDQASRPFLSPRRRGTGDLAANRPRQSGHADRGSCVHSGDAQVREAQRRCASHRS